MQEIKTEIIINASIEKVWCVFTDFDSYKIWNPFMQDIQGKLEIGNTLCITIHPPGKKKMSFKPTIISVIDQQEFSWIGRLLLPGIFDGKHRFELKKLSDKEVKFVQSEQFSGLLSKPIFKMIHESTKLGFEQMNAALKKYCEAKQ